MLSARPMKSEVRLVHVSPRDHEAGGAVDAPSFMPIRATCFLAHRVQPLLADQMLQIGVVLSGVQPNAQPLRLARLPKIFHH